MLTDKKILVTRDINQAEPFVLALKREGAVPVCFPVIAITKPHSWEKVDAGQRSLSEYDWLIFTSENSVTYFFERLHDNHIKLPHIRIAAIGSKTQKALDAYRVSADLIPQAFTAASLLEAFTAFDLKGKRIFLPVSAIARDELYQGLLARGAHVDRIVVYQTQIADPQNKREVIGLLENDEIDILTFFISSAVRNFAKIVGKDVVHLLAENDTPIAVIGPTTAQAVRELSLNPAIAPANATTEELIKAMSDYKIVKE